MAYSQKLEALKEAIYSIRRNQMSNLIRALSNWLGAEGAILFRVESEKLEPVAEFGETSKFSPCSTFNGEQGFLTSQEGLNFCWAKVPIESQFPTYIFTASFAEGYQPDEIALQVVLELLSVFLGSTKNEQNWEHVARAFRVATLGELAAGIAHEINNPLQAIIGNAELLLDTTQLDERAKRKLEDILSAAEKIKEITRAMTNLADARRTEEKELLDFGKVVQEAAQLVSYALVREGVKVKIELSPTPQVWGRRGDLEEIVAQLVQNAGEAIAESGKGSQVTVRVRSEGEKVRLEVEDDGPGIPHDLKERIFDPFVTTKVTRGGTGLGLAIVQNLVTAHGGIIWLEDSPSGGAKFVVELPIWAVAKQ